MKEDRSTTSGETTIADDGCSYQEDRSVNAPTPTPPSSRRHATPLTAPIYDPAMLHAPTVEALVARLLSYKPKADGDLVRRAYAVAHRAHVTQLRQSGEPYIDHPVAVALILLDMQMDDESIAAALLHDVVEDTEVSLDDIRALFGVGIGVLVDGVTKLSVLEGKTKEDAQVGTYRKMFIAMADDPRVVLIKLADRLHNMRTLGATRAEKQERVARETLDIYAPLAHRLGMWQIKSELEDLAFKILDPEKYRTIAQQLALRKEARERVIQRVVERLLAAIEKEGIKAAITGRPKHIYSIARKMERKGVPLDEIYDQLAVRVIVNEVGDCYRVLGIVHNLWTPKLSEFDDYIAMPKESLYRSLHTTVLLPNCIPCEIQIRTHDMHAVAEHGIAAHWRYKEGFGRSDESFEAKLTWLRSLIEWRREITDAREFVEGLKNDLFEEQVYVFTPKGKIIDLPQGSTAIDFAYRIHSDVGHSCHGARVNNRMVPLDYQLQSGEIVDIMTSKNSRGPSRDWLNFVKTSGARNHIRRYFRRLDREENIAAGRDLLEKEMKRLSLKVAFDEIVTIWGSGIRTVPELFHEIGNGTLTARQVAQQVAQKVFASRTEPTDLLAQIPNSAPPPPRSEPGAVRVREFGSILTRFAKCCNPIVGDQIVGFVTRGKGVTVHRADCRTIINESDRNRLIDVSWGDQNPKGYPVLIRVESWDRVGLWRDISAAIADADINIVSVQQGKTRRPGRTILHMEVLVQSLNQLTSILDKLNRIADVIEARRENHAAAD